MKTVLWSLALCVCLASTVAAQAPVPPAGHPAVGSWFGKAVQVCVLPQVCPQAALFMTPTIGADGSFLGNDSFALAGPPFGPHTTAHGKWAPTSATAIVADYVFILPGADGTINALRFQWQAETIDADTMVGYVNIWGAPPIPNTWQFLRADEFPEIPFEAFPIVSRPPAFYRDPAQCPGRQCPFVFKFRIKRVSQ